MDQGRAQTSSMVPLSSPTAVATVFNPTGPPANLSMMQSRMRLSIVQAMRIHVQPAFSACCAMGDVDGAIAWICAKSRTRRNNALAMRGVPRLRRDLMAASSTIGTASGCSTALQDALQRGGIVIVQTAVDAEPRPQRER